MQTPSRSQASSRSHSPALLGTTGTGSMSLVSPGVLQGQAAAAAAAAAVEQGFAYCGPVWLSKEITLSDVGEKIPNGSAVYIGSCAATTEATLHAMVDDPRLQNIEIIQMIPGGALPHLTQHLDSFRTVSFYSFTSGVFFKPDADGAQERLEDYKPTCIAAIPRLLAEHKLKVNVAIIKVSLPHKGFCSLGLGVDATRDFIRHAEIVIAEVNPQMPWTEGPSKVPCSAIDWWIARDEPLLTMNELWPEFIQGPMYPEAVLAQIGQNVLRQIPDGATMRFGITPLAQCVIPYLYQRKDLGLHTDLFTEGMFELHQQGVITNAKKNIDKGRSVVSQATGSQELYSFLDRNPVIEFHPSSYVCDPQVLAKIDNLIAVVGALKIDLTGQVATDSIAHRFYGGVWTDDDSIRGARFSKGGKPIVVLSSKSLRGRSNVVFALPAGTGVSITRSDVEYVVTEYGTAYLYGKSIRSRVLSLIEIAHPDFRQELLAEAKRWGYVSHSQPGKAFGSIYPSHFECVHKTKKDRSVFIRPIKAKDNDKLRNFFFLLSEHSVYLRYFRRMKSMPQRILQKATDVDYSTDMAIVALSPPDAHPKELVGIAQWISGNHDGIPEIAFQVRDDWQGEGLGSYLFERLVEIARSLGLPKLKADVLADNRGMNAIFKNAAVPFVRKNDFGVVTYEFDLLQQGTPLSPPNDEAQQQQHPAPQVKT